MWQTWGGGIPLEWVWACKNIKTNKQTKKLKTDHHNCGESRNLSRTLSILLICALPLLRSIHAICKVPSVVRFQNAFWLTTSMKANAQKKYWKSKRLCCYKAASLFSWWERGHNPDSMRSTIPITNAILCMGTLVKHEMANTKDGWHIKDKPFYLLMEAKGKQTNKQNFLKRWVKYHFF